MCQTLGCKIEQRSQAINWAKFTEEFAGLRLTVRDLPPGWREREQSSLNSKPSDS
jgi:hypothetical protein